jgi:hypothetical protein
VTQTLVSCPLCSDARSEALFELRNAPVLQNKLLPTIEAALAASRVDTTYHYCARCNFAFNLAFDGSALSYGSYYNKQSESSTYRQYIEDLTHQLAVDCRLGAASTILEIGCGNGYFLSRLQAATGSSNVHGYDPSYRGEYGMDAHVQRRFFDSPDIGAGADFVVLRHCLEGLLQANPVMSLLRDAGEASRVYLEITDLDYILTERNPALLFNEYYRYFSVRAMDIFLRQVGFRVQRVYALFGGNNLGITAARAPKTTDLHGAYRELESIVRRHHKVVIWGISGRAISLLCQMSWDGSIVAHGVDIDPARQGRYIPVTGQRILSPAEAKAFDPDLVIVANEIYAPEIRAALGVGAKLVTLKGQPT